MANQSNGEASEYVSVLRGEYKYLFQDQQNALDVD